MHWGSWSINFWKLPKTVLLSICVHWHETEGFNCSWRISKSASKHVCCTTNWFQLSPHVIVILQWGIKWYTKIFDFVSKFIHCSKTQLMWQEVYTYCGRNYIYCLFPLNTSGTRCFSWQNWLETRKFLGVYHVYTSFIKHVTIEAQLRA